MSSFLLKIIALISMTIDHIGFALYPQYSILRDIGRLAFVIFAFQIGVGFSHTKSKEKYLIRMIIFALVSQLPFQLLLNACNPNSSLLLNIGFTFTFGLLALYCLEKVKSKPLKYIFTLIIIALSFYVPMDYGYYGVITVIVLYIFRNNKLLMSACYAIVLFSYCGMQNSAFNLPAIFALIPICLYNGKKGPNIKYLFYIFYPLHLLILFYVKTKFFIN